MEAARNRYGSPDYRAAQGVMRGVLVASLGEQYAEDMAPSTVPSIWSGVRRTLRFRWRWPSGRRGCFPGPPSPCFPASDIWCPPKRPASFVLRSSVEDGIPGEAGMTGEDGDARTGSW